MQLRTNTFAARVCAEDIQTALREYVECIAEEDDYMALIRELLEDVLDYAHLDL